MSSSSNVFTSSLLRPLEAQLVEALSALNLAPETIRDGEIEPEDAVALIENHRTTLPCMTEVQWAAFKSAIRRLARTREDDTQQRLEKKLDLVLEEMKQKDSILQAVVFGQFIPAVSTASSADSRSYPKDAIEYYKLRQVEDEVEKVFCMVTRELCIPSQLTAGHIYMQSWPAPFLGLLGGELHDPTNIIVMQKPLEKRFDAWDWTIIPEGPDDYRIHVLNPALLENSSAKYITGNDGKSRTWAEINGQLLEWGGLNRPSRRLCGFHAKLAINRAEVKRWLNKDSLVVPAAAWESPTFDKGLMEAFLRDAQPDFD